MGDRRVRRLDLRRVAGRRAGAPVGVAAVALLAALACSPSGALSPTGAGPTPSSPSTATVSSPSSSPSGGAATPSVSPSAAQTQAPSTGQAWARLPDNPDLAGTFIGGLDLAGPDRVLGAGYVALGEGKVVGAIWASGDGRSWKRLTGRPGFEDAAVSEITRAPDGTFLATGSTCYYECSGVRMWRSVDGVSWNAVAHDLPDSAFIKLIPGGPGWIGVGEVDLPFGRLAAWTSADGTSWTPSTGMGPGQGAIRGLVATAEGYLAAGSVYPEDRAEPAIWLSPDGHAWSRMSPDAGPQGLGLDALGQIGGRLAAFVRAEDGITLWTSTNGDAWTQRAGASKTFAIDGSPVLRMVIVEPAGPGLVAFGVDDAHGALTTRIWLSADGLTWDPARDTRAFVEGVEVYDAVRLGDEALAVGRLACDIETCVERPVIWVSPPG